MFEYIVQYSNRNFLINVQHKEDIIAAACKRINIRGLATPNTPCRIEILHNKDLGIYVDITPEELPEEATLKLIFEEEEDPVSSPNTSENAIASSSTELFTPAATSSKTLQEEGFTNWCLTFGERIALMPHDLRNALEQELPLSKKLRMSLLDFLYKEMCRFTLFPTSSNYDVVAGTLLHYFPYLYKFVTFGEAKEIWRVRLSTKARNTRQRRDRELPSVVSKRLKWQSMADRPKGTDGSRTSQSTAKKSPAYGLVNYLPARPPSEDDCSVLKHIELMKSQCTNTTDDVRKVDQCMDLTLHHRRQLIVQQSVGIPAIIDMYPTLCDPLQICYEFQRIAEVDPCSAIMDKMGEYCRPILRLRRVDLSGSLVGKSPEDQIEALSCRALLELPRLLGEVVHFAAPPAKEEASPSLSFEGDPSLPTANGTLRADGKEICRFRGLLMGACVWLASYYIFDVPYPTRCKKTLVFLQRVVLGLKDKSKTPLKVLTLMQQINELNGRGD